MKKYSLTSGKVRSFFGFLSRQFNCEVRRLQSDDLRWYLRRLKKRGIDMDFSAIVFWNRIYTRFELGEMSGKSLVGQVRIGVHEIKHIRQGQQQGLFRQTLRYLFNSQNRALAEAEGFAAQYQLDHYMKGNLDWDRYTQRLKPRYRVREKDMAQVSLYFERVKQRLKRGVYDGSVQTCIDWLLEHDCIKDDQ